MPEWSDGEARNDAQGEPMIRTARPTLAIMLLAAGILSVPEHHRRASVMRRDHHRPARFAAGPRCAPAPFGSASFRSAPFRFAAVRNCVARAHWRPCREVGGTAGPASGTTRPPPPRPGHSTSPRPSARAPCHRASRSARTAARRAGRAPWAMRRWRPPSRG